MHALTQWPWLARRKITGVLTDIDDTLTTGGAITPDALAALHGLKAAGLPVIAVTGRPAGWSAPFALAWPVDAIVAENGAVALFSRQNCRLAWPGEPGRLSKIYQQAAPLRQANRVRIGQVARRVLQEVAGATLARDSAGRETDLAIDHSEFTRLGAAGIAQALQIMHSEGMQASVSSIHINGWFGAHNKLEGARWIVRELLGRDLAAEMDHWVFVGDSTNDQLMFEAFGNSIGVANVRDFEAQLSHRPRYVTQGARGAGFAEMAAALLAAHAE